MALNSTMRGLLEKEWATMMVANSHEQCRTDSLRINLRGNASIRSVIDYSQCWERTPQGYRYWVRIVNRL